MGDIARRTLVATVVVVAVVAAALALWKLRVLVALLFLAVIIAAAMRPTVDRLARHGIPRAMTIAIHYLALGCLVALLILFAVPRAIDQLGAAVGGSVPTSREELTEAAKRTTGTTQDILVALRERLEAIPQGERLLDPAIEATKTAFEVVVGIFFVLAAAAYWIYERDRAVDYVLSMLPRRRRRVVRATWDLIDLKLGAFVRGQVLLVIMVASVLSASFRAIDLPYWILIGTFAGVVELIPVIGPLSAAAVAIGVGLTVSWQLALGAGAIVFVVRMAEDYVVIPRVLGHAVGLSPLTVLVAVAAFGLVLGGGYVLLAIPVVAVLITVLDVALRNRDPEAEDVPTVIFPAQDRETVGS